MVENLPDSVPPDEGSDVPSSESVRIHAEYTAELIAAREKAFEAFDRSVLTLSTATLSLSVGFVSNLVPIEDAELVWLLAGSWAGFALAILSTLVSFQTSRLAMDAQIDIANRLYLEDDDAAAGQVPVWARITGCLNWTSAVSFGAGVVATVVFVAVNVL